MSRVIAVLLFCCGLFAQTTETTILVSWYSWEGPTAYAGVSTYGVGVATWSADPDIAAFKVTVFYLDAWGNTLTRSQVVLREATWAWTSTVFVLSYSPVKIKSIAVIPLKVAGPGETVDNPQ